MNPSPHSRDTGENGDNSFGRTLLERVLAGTPAGEQPLTFTAELPPRVSRFAEWPEWAADAAVRALRAAGIPQPWSHQAEAASIAAAGEHVVVATGTASGKSLAYQLPVLTALAGDSRGTALYLSPTKALGADQLRAAIALTESEPELGSIHPSGFDGDTPTEVRQWARANSRWIFTNPDMLHIGILRSHQRWSHLFRNLRYVVVDECHSYRGVFGSNVALVLRRLRRIAARYGANPVFVLASATTADPGAAASRLIGAPCAEVTEDGSPHGPRTIALWEPPLLTSVTGENGAPVRRAAGSEASRIMADLLVEGARTLTFVRSRRGAELTAMGTRRALTEIDPDLAGRVAAYRAGYLAEDRRELETALADGRLLGVATTNALELGVDIAGLDAVVVAGFPGTVASFWQQAGRSGRRGEGSLVVLVARDDPLDTYLVHHPSALLNRPVEATVTDPTNPYVLGPQLLCAALELPLSDAEVTDFGGTEVLTELAAQGLIRRRAHGWFVTAESDPHSNLDIRGGIGGQVAIVDGESGRLLGTVDTGRAPATAHPGAVHIHQGESFVVDHLDLDEGIALVHSEDPDWTTSAREITDIAISDVAEHKPYGDVGVALVQVEVTHQVVGYLRRLSSGEVLDSVELDMPAQTLQTRAVMYTITPELLEESGIGADRVPGALHAAEHAAIGLLPLVATCDRGDIGGVSTALHPDTGLPTVFVYDGHPGGAGFADRGHAELVRWLSATRDAIDSCECAAGCPSCVHSPKCGNGNHPLDKDGAVRVLAAVLAAVDPDRTVA
ncbi:DEAD/DEAH box helicase [Rhodococcus sp. TAF43]|uniref:DEAD/DEAH box helicase n=1 Tax=unclassified Rhodococcus (in: high G+C Gram-positive bacteria) TaxID=192944 RepID=UPI000E0B1708|nr:MULTISPECIES: DEAD/DEAH box helicase [unclassified Rhodococcus (in: high G+C Gram-positive bacteria)]QKT09867.1 DEAD/DEAH box helicase [Rhodococcus sp. W8901]RDI28038.1 DEAD/DEAH box helicase domain-containing protein [Rhodococcus sp. AG1013]